MGRDTRTARVAPGRAARHVQADRHLSTPDAGSPAATARTRSRPVLEVVEPGLLTTIQDAGRFGYAQFGVPESGPCDPWSFAQANLLAGNPLDSAALEVTLVGPELRFLIDTVLGIAGAELEAFVAEEYRDLPAGAAHLVRGGTTVQFRATTSASGVPAIRSYVAIAGGIDVPVVLGSRSTCLAGGFGGLDGRALRTGDRLLATAVSEGQLAGRIWPKAIDSSAFEPTSSSQLSDVELRIVPGPQASQGTDLLTRLTQTTWQVVAESDRRGVRLAARVAPERVDTRADGRVERPEPRAAQDHDIVSQPMVRGAVQVPPDGSPIVLLADYQTVGGYPVPAVVIRADWPVCGQLAGGSSVRFVCVSIEEAEEAYREQLGELDRGRVALERSDPWELLTDMAGSLRTLGT